MSITRRAWLACHDCDLLHRLADIPEGAAACCTRCGAPLAIRHHRALEKALAEAAREFCQATLGPVAVVDEHGTDAIAVHHVGNLGLTWDHRVFDGSTAVLFLRRIKENLETWDWDQELA